MKKYLLSAFVVLSFVAYAFQKRLTVQEVSSSLTTSTTIPTQTNSQTLPPSPVVTTAPASPVTQTPITPPIVTFGFKDGTYTGPVTDAFYGNVQVQAIIKGGKITDVNFLQYPNDRNTSREINSQATPVLSSEAIKSQSANVDVVSGATATSEAFIQSLQAALTQAKV